MAAWDKVDVVEEKKSGKQNNSLRHHEQQHKSKKPLRFLLVYTRQFPSGVSFHLWDFRPGISVIHYLSRLKLQSRGWRKKPHHCFMVTFCRTICCTPYFFALAALWIMEKYFLSDIFLCLFFRLGEYKRSGRQCSVLPFIGKGKTYVTHMRNDLSTDAAVPSKNMCSALCVTFLTGAHD